MAVLLETVNPPLPAVVGDGVRYNRECRDSMTQTSSTRALEFRELLSQRIMVVADGAMGTMLYANGVFINRCFDELSLSSPDLVSGIHRDYVAAGAEILETNTFGANRVRLGGSAWRTS